MVSCFDGHLYAFNHDEAIREIAKEVVAANQVMEEHGWHGIDVSYLAIEEIAKDKAVILSTHILPEASRLCDRVLILDRGVCRADDTPEALSRALSERPRLRLVARPRGQVQEHLARISAVTVVAAGMGSAGASTRNSPVAAS